YGAARYRYMATETEPDRIEVPDLGVRAERTFEPPLLAELLYPLGTGTAPCPSDIMVRRSAMIRVGGFDEAFTGRMQLYEDQTFLAKIYVHERVHVASETWTEYRVHDGSCSAA